MAQKSSTEYEFVCSGVYARVQYCEHINADGNVCDEYLGYEYPSELCHEHDPNWKKKPPLQNESP